MMTRSGDGPPHENGRYLMGFLIGAVLLAMLLQPRGEGQGLGCCLVWVALGVGFIAYIVSHII